LKQALFVLHGTTRLFNELTVETQRSLWNGVASGVQTTFEETTRSFKPPLPDSGAVLEAIKVKNLPVRLLRRNKPTSQRPISPWKTTQTGSFELRLLQEVLIENFNFSEEELAAFKEKVVVQGIVVPLNAPVYHLWHLMCHCDLFMYISLLI
jgi:hypothetical protein